MRDDVDVGGARIREFEDRAVAFLVTSDDERILVTIANVQPVSVEPRLEVALEGVSLIAMHRGASGR